MTQSNLAAIFGVSPALISSWEKGTAVPPPQRLGQYAAIFRPEDTDSLVTELILLRGQAEPAQQTIVDVLKDIRWLLVEIRDRLPPRKDSS